jgi:hypothetical protein
MRRPIKSAVRKPVRVARSDYTRGRLRDDEPTFDGPLTDAEIRVGLEWYRFKYNELPNSVELETARGYLADYLDSLDEGDLAGAVRIVDPVWVSTTAGWLARMFLRGADLDDARHSFILERAEEMVAHLTVSDRARFRTPEERQADRLREFLGEVNEIVDARDELGDDFSFVDYLTETAPPQHYVRAAERKLRIALTEMLDAVDGNDPDLVEAYERYDPDELLLMIATYSELADGCLEYLSERVATRAPRPPKPVSPEKLLKHLRYQESHGELRSIDPNKILGAQELWTYNTRYNVVTVYRAAGAEGLSIHRSSVIGHDEATSASYRPGRRSAELVKRLSEGTRAAARRVGEEMSPTTLAPRINENTILLRVFR